MEGYLILAVVVSLQLGVEGDAAHGIKGPGRLWNRLAGPEPSYAMIRHFPEALDSAAFPNRASWGIRPFPESVLVFLLHQLSPATAGAQSELRCRVSQKG